MFNSNLTLQGLAIGIIACISTPITYSYYSTGGGAKEIASKSQNQQKTQQTPAKKEVIKPIKTTSLLLTGTNGQNGVVAKLSLYLEESGNKKGNVDKVSGQGAQGRNNGTLFYDDKTKEYIFTDKSGIERGDNTCGGRARKGSTYKVCLANGVVLSQYENTYRTKFPKIKLDGGKVTGSSLRGYNVNKMPSHLNYCNKVNVQKRENDDLAVSIICQNSTLQKVFKDPESNDNTLSK